MDPGEEPLAGLPTAVPFARTFDGAYGLEPGTVTADRAEGRVAVGSHLLGPDGTVPAGVHAAIAESLASVATAAEVIPEGRAAAGLSNSTTVLADVRDGVLEARATRRSRGAGEWVWDVEVADGDGRPCAIATVVVSVRLAVKRR
jgi:1,4-dihydroxy-2-naphthoyl-CoA hydrolase